MSDPKPRLDIVIADTDKIGSATLAAALREASPTTNVAVVETADGASEWFARDRANALVVDIFSLGMDDALPLIDRTRKEHPTFPICLTGTREQLGRMPNVPRHWQGRFSHYYKLPKDEYPTTLRAEAQSMAYKLFTYWLARTAKVRLHDLRGSLLEMERRVPELKHDDGVDISGAIEMAELAIEAQGEQVARAASIVPGFGDDALQKLVNQTVERASRAVEWCAQVNTGILIFGAGLIAIAFVIASITGRWEAVAFGGFGLAGVITSLITNPLKSIGFASRRLVQIQVAYVGFLKQVAFLNDCPHETVEDVISKSRRLEEATKSIQETLSQHFG